MKNIFKPFILGLIFISLLGAAAFSAVSLPIRSALSANGDRLYVPSTTSITSINISNPSSPVSTGNLSFSFASPTIYDLQTYQFSSNNYLFASAINGSDGKIYVFDTNTDPGTKVATISMPAGVSPRGVAITSSSVTMSLPMGSGKTTYTGHLFVAATNGNVYRYAVSDAQFNDATKYTLSATYETGTSGLFGIAVKQQPSSGPVASITPKYFIYTSSLDHGQIIRISSTDESTVTLDSTCTGATYLNFSADQNLLFARVLQSDKDVRVFDLAVEPNAEIPSMAVGLGGSASVYSGSNYEGNYYAGNGLYFSKYDSTAALEKLYKYEPSSEAATSGWSRTRAITSWTPGATDYLVAATYEAGWAVWRTNSEYGSYSLILVDTGTEEITTTPTTETGTIEVIDDFEGVIIPDDHYSANLPPLFSGSLSINRATGTSYDGSFAMKAQYSSSTIVTTFSNAPYWCGTYEAGSTVDLTNCKTVRFHYQGDGTTNKFYLFLIEESGSDGVEELFSTPGSYTLNNTSWATAEVNIADFTLASNSPSGGNGTFDKKIIGYRIVYSGKTTSVKYHYFDNIQGVSGESGTADITAAASVENFRASDGEDSKVTLTWTNPADSDLGEITVLRKEGAYPSSHSDTTATSVYNSITPTPSNPESYIDTSVTNGTTYYYAVFSKDTSANWNDAISVEGNADTGTPGTAATAEAIISNLSLTREADASLSAVILSWVSTPTGSVDIWTKTNTFSAVATDWTLEYSGVSDLSKSDVSQVGNGIHKFYKVVPAGHVVNDSDLTSEVVCKFDLNLSEGSNLISVPLLPADANITTMLGNQLASGTPATADKVYYFDASSVSWLSSYLSSSTGWSGTLASVEADKGYFVDRQVGAGAVFVSVVGAVCFDSSRNISLYQNDNMIGTVFPQAANLDTSNLTSVLTSGTPATADKVYYFDAASSSWLSSYLTSAGTFSGTLTTFEPGKGYYIENQSLITSPDPDLWNYTK